MNELDMSRSGSELFPEAAMSPALQYNSYQDVNVGQFVDDPLNTGVTQPDVAGQVQLSQKEMNFGALREEVAKMKEEREYWKGQAEAYARQPSRMPEPAAEAQHSFDALDWDNSSDVRKAWEAVRNDNQRLREEIKDTLAAVSTKSQHQDWNTMVTRHVPELTSKNSIFAEMIQKVSNPYEAAYALAELNARAQPAAQQPPPEYQMHGNAQRAIANSHKPQSPNSVGGHGQLSSADYYASMSDEDFMKIAAKNLANI